MQTLRRRFLLLYMLRVPLLFLTILGFVLPAAFQSPMFHGLADLTLRQVATVAALASILISSAITGAFLVLLYGHERADGWMPQPPPQDRVSLWSIALLYAYAGIGYLWFLYSIYQFMQEAGRVPAPLGASFLLYAFFGWFVGLLVILIFFLGALRFAKPADDDALEVFAFPAFLILRKIFGGAWIRAFKGGTHAHAAVGSYAAHDGFFSHFFAKRLGPGYGTQNTPERPATLHSGHRFVTVVMLIFLLCYWLSGVGTLHDLRSLQQWSGADPSSAVLSYVLLLLIFWSSLLTGVTFFVDRFRFPALLSLSVVLFLISFSGSSDHVFSTVDRSKAGDALATPAHALQQHLAGQPVIVVAAAGGGIQSAAWTSRVLCGLRADLRNDGFQKSVLAVSGVSGGSVGTMFYLRCLEEPEENQQPAKWAQASSLEAIAWGLTHPDLRNMFLPFLPDSWKRADRGWALERSLLKSAAFQSTERRLADSHPDWPVVLLNSTDALTGDPVVFTNSQFPNTSNGSSRNHYLRNFYQLDLGKDVLLETAARMSASFPYVSPEARTEDRLPNRTFGAHFGDGGYFDNSGVFTLSEWLKEAASGNAPADSSGVPAAARQRILILQLDAFPDSDTKDESNGKKWYYQLLSPLDTILNVRSEGQLVRDGTAGEDLQKILNAGGYQTTWMLVRYDPKGLGLTQNGRLCPSDPPLSWHLTPAEQGCIDNAWSQTAPRAEETISDFLRGPLQFTPGACQADHKMVLGVFVRRCAAATPEPAQNQKSPSPNLPMRKLPKAGGSDR